mmetsp:Transcript_16525/g.45133  ORF Transcript_16525/g.45133 Transcript_16525/m.45133 type:complete len:357 (-) Transcript_16525:1019-2089(-)
MRCLRRRRPPEPHRTHPHSRSWRSATARNRSWQGSIGIRSSSRRRVRPSRTPGSRSCTSSARRACAGRRRCGSARRWRSRRWTRALGWKSRGWMTCTASLRTSSKKRGRCGSCIRRSGASTPTVSTQPSAWPPRPKTKWPRPRNSPPYTRLKTPRAGLRSNCCGASVISWRRCLKHSTPLKRLCESRFAKNWGSSARSFWSRKASCARCKTRPLWSFRCKARSLSSAAWSFGVRAWRFESYPSAPKPPGASPTITECTRTSTSRTPTTSGSALKRCTTSCSRGRTSSRLLRRRWRQANEQSRCSRARLRGWRWSSPPRATRGRKRFTSGAAESRRCWTRSGGGATRNSRRGRRSTR